MQRHPLGKEMKERLTILGSSRLESRSQPTQNCSGGSPFFSPFEKEGYGDFKLDFH
jgi:hypothetical protein